jgi:hypothetical protein
VNCAFVAGHRNRHILNLDPGEIATQQDLSDSDLHANIMAQNVLLETSMGSIVVELYNNHAPKVSVNGIVPRYY